MFSRDTPATLPADLPIVLIFYCNFYKLTLWHKLSGFKVVKVSAAGKGSVMDILLFQVCSFYCLS
jgi:hypothetical protein